jgi:hypothetical protein
MRRKHWAGGLIGSVVCLGHLWMGFARTVLWLRGVRRISRNKLRRRREMQKLCWMKLYAKAPLKVLCTVESQRK